LPSYLLISLGEMVALGAPFFSWVGCTVGEGVNVGGGVSVGLGVGVSSAQRGGW
jgi:tetrahydrodipicolinate N-succinyltransferase